MFQNMLVTGLAPLSSKTEVNSWENRPFRTVWPEQNKQKSKDVTRTIRKKPKRVRTAFSTEQIRTLERTYASQRYIDRETRQELAESLNIGDRSIKVWFQNRRMKEKRESSESSNDSSSESLESETPTIPESPPPQVNPECNIQDYNQFYYSNNPEYSYQVPPYYEDHQNMYGLQATNLSDFYNDTNVYPTQYYPIDMNFASVEGNCFNSNYGLNEMNQYTPPNLGSYYAHV